MVCSLCLEEIDSDELQVTVDERVRHKNCSDELEENLVELAKIYDETCDQDI
jgi:hypothetical protein